MIASKTWLLGGSVALLIGCATPQGALLGDISQLNATTPSQGDRPLPPSPKCSMGTMPEGPRAESPSGGGAAPETAEPLVAGSFSPDVWLPIVAGEELSEILPAHVKLAGAGIASTAYGGKDYVVIVTAKDFNRARKLLLGDSSTRPFIVTRTQIDRWLRSHPEAKKK